MESERSDWQSTNPDRPPTGEPTQPTQRDEQSDYAWGRESWRDFPRRSTSQSARRGYETRNEWMDRFTGATRESDYPKDYDRYEERGYRNRLRREQEGRPYRDREYNRERGYERGSGFENRTYEGRRLKGENRDYSSAGRNYREEEEFYRDPYDRETFSGQFGSYGPGTRSSRIEYDTPEDRYGWGDRYGRSYLRCEDIMTKDVTTCSPQTPLRQVAERMEDEDVGSIPIVEDGRLIGIVTDRDIVCRILAQRRDTRSATAADTMSQDIVTVNRDESVMDAIQKMGQYQIRRLPVVDQNFHLRGIISLADIALEAENDRQLAEAIEQISQPTPFQSRKRPGRGAA
jgi:CBS domain-containing protein